LEKVEEIVNIKLFLFNGWDWHSPAKKLELDLSRVAN
jgi:hypothetical protein